MTLYTAVILKENSKFYLKIGSADIISKNILSKLQNITEFIQQNLYESQIAWHYGSNIPLMEITVEQEQFIINSPYLKFLYTMPVWKFKIKSVMNSLSKEFNNATLTNV